MYSRDYILNEARKMAAILAKLLGLKMEGDLVNFEAETATTLKGEFQTDLDTLVNQSEEDFTRQLLHTAYSAEKLNALGELIFIRITPLQAGDEDTIALLQKILLIYELLEQRYHYQTFENIGRRAEIEKFLAG